MSYERLDFEDRRGGVFVASGLGFKAPEKWGRATRQPADRYETHLAETGMIRVMSAINKWSTIKLSVINPYRKIEALIETELQRLLNPELREGVETLQHESDAVEVELMVASAEASVVLRSRQDLIKKDLVEARRQVRVETELVEKRITELRGLRFPGTKGIG